MRCAIYVYFCVIAVGLGIVLEPVVLVQVLSVVGLAAAIDAMQCVRLYQVQLIDRADVVKVEKKPLQIYNIVFIKNI